MRGQGVTTALPNLVGAASQPELIPPTDRNTHPRLTTPNYVHLFLWLSVILFLFTIMVLVVACVCGGAKLKGHPQIVERAAPPQSSNDDESPEAFVRDRLQDGERFSTRRREER